MIEKQTEVAGYLKGDTGDIPFFFALGCRIHGPECADKGAMHIVATSVPWIRIGDGPWIRSAYISVQRSRLAVQNAFMLAQP